jgi:glutathione synthase/RimK-type ligase-like ATP-grasp enzyme
MRRRSRDEPARPIDPVIAVATHRAAPGATEDDALALPRLAERCRATVEAVPWDSPDADWQRYAAVLLRSTWDYHLHLDAFLAWTARVEATGTDVWNPASVVRWNADKSYLRAVEAAGVPIVPTEWILRGDGAELGAALRRRGWSRAVVKPSVGATAFRTYLTSAEETDRHGTLLSDVHSQGDALVQPYLPQVGREGEWSFVYLDDGAGALAFSHAVVKRSAAGDFRVQDEFGGTVERVTPPPALLRQATRAAGAVSRLAPGPLLYARLDGVVSDGAHAPAGSLLLMEVELIEPLLFLACAAGAADRFAAAVARRLATPGPGEGMTQPDFNVRIQPT